MNPAAAGGSTGRRWPEIAHQAAARGLEGDALMLNWGKRRDHTLLPLQEHVYEFDHGTQRACFVLEGGAVTELVVRDQAGGEWRLPRRD